VGSTAHDMLSASPALTPLTVPSPESPTSQIAETDLTWVNVGVVDNRLLHLDGQLWKRNRRGDWDARYMALVPGGLIYDANRERIRQGIGRRVRLYEVLNAECERVILNKSQTEIYPIELLVSRRGRDEKLMIGTNDAATRVFWTRNLRRLARPNEQYAWFQKRILKLYPTLPSRVFVGNPKLHADLIKYKILDDNPAEYPMLFLYTGIYEVQTRSRLRRDFVLLTSKRIIAYRSSSIQVSVDLDRIVGVQYAYSSRGVMQKIQGLIQQVPLLGNFLKNAVNIPVAVTSSIMGKVRSLTSHEESESEVSTTVGRSSRFFDSDDDSDEGEEEEDEEEEDEFDIPSQDGKEVKESIRLTSPSVHGTRDTKATRGQFSGIRLFVHNNEPISIRLTENNHTQSDLVLVTFLGFVLQTKAWADHQHHETLALRRSIWFATTQLASAYQCALPRVVLRQLVSMTSSHAVHFGLSALLPLRYHLEQAAAASNARLLVRYNSEFRKNLNCPVSPYAMTVENAPEQEVSFESQFYSNAVKLLAKRVGTKILVLDVRKRSGIEEPSKYDDISDWTGASTKLLLTRQNLVPKGKSTNTGLSRSERGPKVDGYNDHFEFFLNEPTASPTQLFAAWSQDGYEKLTPLMTFQEGFVRESLRALGGKRPTSSNSSDDVTQDVIEVALNHELYSAKRGFLISKWSLDGGAQTFDSLEAADRELLPQGYVWKDPTWIRFYPYGKSDKYDAEGEVISPGSRVQRFTRTMVRKLVHKQTYEARESTKLLEQLHNQLAPPRQPSSLPFFAISPDTLVFLLKAAELTNSETSRSAALGLDRRTLAFVGEVLEMDRSRRGSIMRSPSSMTTMLASIPRSPSVQTPFRRMEPESRADGIGLDDIEGLPDVEMDLDGIEGEHFSIRKLLGLGGGDTKPNEAKSDVLSTGPPAQNEPKSSNVAPMVRAKTVFPVQVPTVQTNREKFGVNPSDPFAILSQMEFASEDVNGDIYAEVKDSDSQRLLKKLKVPVAAPSPSTAKTVSPEQMPILVIRRWQAQVCVNPGGPSPAESAFCPTNPPYFNDLGQPCEDDKLLELGYVWDGPWMAFVRMKDSGLRNSGLYSPSFMRMDSIVTQSTASTGLDDDDDVADVAAAVELLPSALKELYTDEQGWILSPPDRADSRIYRVRCQVRIGVKKEFGLRSLFAEWLPQFLDSMHHCGTSAQLVFGGNLPRARFVLAPRLVDLARNEVAFPDPSELKENDTRSERRNGAGTSNSNVGSQAIIPKTGIFKAGALQLNSIESDLMLGTAMHLQPYRPHTEECLRNLYLRQFIPMTRKEYYETCVVQPLAAKLSLAAKEDVLLARRAEALTQAALAQMSRLIARARLQRDQARAALDLAGMSIQDRCPMPAPWVPPGIIPEIHGFKDPGFLLAGNREVEMPMVATGTQRTRVVQRPPTPQTQYYMLLQKAMERARTGFTVQNQPPNPSSIYAEAVAPSDKDVRDAGVNINPFLLPLRTAPPEAVGYLPVFATPSSGAQHPLSIWRPVPPKGYVNLGDVASRSLRTPDILSARCCVQDRADLLPPLGFKLRLTLVNHDLPLVVNIYDMIPPLGYIALGCVAATADVPLNRALYRCVPEHLTLPFCSELKFKSPASQADTSVLPPAPRPQLLPTAAQARDVPNYHLPRLPKKAGRLHDAVLAPKEALKIDSDVTESDSDADSVSDAVDLTRIRGQRSPKASRQASPKVGLGVAAGGESSLDELSDLDETKELSESKEAASSLDDFDDSDDDSSDEDSDSSSSSSGVKPIAPIGRKFIPPLKALKPATSTKSKRKPYGPPKAPPLPHPTDDLRPKSKGDESSSSLSDLEESEDESSYTHDQNQPTTTTPEKAGVPSQGANEPSLTASSESLSSRSGSHSSSTSLETSTSRSTQTTSEQVKTGPSTSDPRSGSAPLVKDLTDSETEDIAATESDDNRESELEDSEGDHHPTGGVDQAHGETLTKADVEAIPPVDVDETDLQTERATATLPPFTGTASQRAPEASPASALDCDSSSPLSELEDSTGSVTESEDEPIADLSPRHRRTDVHTRRSVLKPFRIDSQRHRLIPLDLTSDFVTPDQVRVAFGSFQPMFAPSVARLMYYEDRARVSSNATEYFIADEPHLQANKRANTRLRNPAFCIHGERPCNDAFCGLRRRKTATGEIHEMMVPPQDACSLLVNGVMGLGTRELASRATNTTEELNWRDKEIERAVRMEEQRMLRPELIWRDERNFDRVPSLVAMIKRRATVAASNAAAQPGQPGRPQPSPRHQAERHQGGRDQDVALKLQVYQLYDGEYTTDPLVVQRALNQARLARDASHTLDDASNVHKLDLKVSQGEEVMFATLVKEPGQNEVCFSIWRMPGTGLFQIGYGGFGKRENVCPPDSFRRLPYSCTLGDAAISREVHDVVHTYMSVTRELIAKISHRVYLRRVRRDQLKKAEEDRERAVAEARAEQEKREEKRKNLNDLLKQGLQVGRIGSGDETESDKEDSDETENDDDDDDFEDDTEGSSESTEDSRTTSTSESSSSESNAYRRKKVGFVASIAKHDDESKAPEIPSHLSAERIDQLRREYEECESTTFEDDAEDLEKVVDLMTWVAFILRHYRRIAISIATRSNLERCLPEGPVDTQFVPPKLCLPSAFAPLRHLASKRAYDVKQVQPYLFGVPTEAWNNEDSPVRQELTSTFVPALSKLLTNLQYELREACRDIRGPILSRIARLTKDPVRMNLNALVLEILDIEPILPLIPETHVASEPVLQDALSENRELLAFLEDQKPMAFRSLIDSIITKTLFDRVNHRRTRLRNRLGLKVDSTRRGTLEEVLEGFQFVSEDDEKQTEPELVKQILEESRFDLIILTRRLPQVPHLEPQVQVLLTNLLAAFQEVLGEMEKDNVRSQILLSLILGFGSILDEITPLSECASLAATYTEFVKSRFQELCTEWASPQVLLKYYWQDGKLNNIWVNLCASFTNKAEAANIVDVSFVRELWVNGVVPTVTSVLPVLQLVANHLATERSPLWAANPLEIAQSAAGLDKREENKRLEEAASVSINLTPLHRQARDAYEGCPRSMDFNPAEMQQLPLSALFRLAYEPLDTDPFDQMENGLNKILASIVSKKASASRSKVSVDPRLEEKVDSGPSLEEQIAECRKQITDAKVGTVRTIINSMSYIRSQARDACVNIALHRAFGMVEPPLTAEKGQVTSTMLTFVLNALEPRDNKSWVLQGREDLAAHLYHRAAIVMLDLALRNPSGDSIFNMRFLGISASKFAEGIAESKEAMTEKQKKRREKEKAKKSRQGSTAGETVEEPPLQPRPDYRPMLSTIGALSAFGIIGNPDSVLQGKNREHLDKVSDLADFLFEYFLRDMKSDWQRVVGISRLIQQLYPHVRFHTKPPHELVVGMRVMAVSATNVLGLNTNGTSDPYVTVTGSFERISLPSYRFSANEMSKLSTSSLSSPLSSPLFKATMLTSAELETPKVSNTVNPVWNSVVFVPGADASSVRIRVYDYERIGSNRLMGVVEIGPNQLQTAYDATKALLPVRESRSESRGYPAIPNKVFSTAPDRSTMASIANELKLSPEETAELVKSSETDLIYKVGVFELPIKDGGDPRLRGRPLGRIRLLIYEGAFVSDTNDKKRARE